MSDAENESRILILGQQGLEIDGNIDLKANLVQILYQKEAGPGTPQVCLKIIE
jgi:hypothetical protein